MRVLAMAVLLYPEASPSFPRRRKSIRRLHLYRTQSCVRQMDSRFHGNDITVREPGLFLENKISDRPFQDLLIIVREYRHVLVSG